MTAFADLAQKPGVGVVWFFYVLLDGTYTYNYSTQWWSSPGGGFLESSPRIVSLGNLTRGFGADSGFVAGSIDVTLENTDSGVDWLVSPESFSTVIGSVWQFQCLLYDPQNPSDYNTKVLGLYTFLNPPTRNNTTISFTLADGGIGKIADLAQTPTLRDWAGITDASRPATLSGTHVDAGVCVNGVIEFNDVWDKPFPLVWEYRHAATLYNNALVICAVPGAPGSLSVTVDAIETAKAPALAYGLSLPAQLTEISHTFGSSTVTTSQIWTVRRTPTITKDGKDWHLLWVDFGINSLFKPHDAMLAWLHEYGLFDFSKFASDAEAQLFGPICPITVRGCLGSHNADRTYRQFTAPEIAKDIVTTCLPSALTIMNIDDVIAARPAHFAGGFVGKGERSSNFASSGGEASEALKGLCVAGQFDLFFNWSGTMQAAAPINNYAAQTATLATLSDDDTAEVTERIPTVGQRYAPANRVWVYIGGRRQSSDDATAIASWNTIVAKDIESKWIEHVWQFKFDSTIRSVVSAVTGLNGLNFELGDFISFSWLRGSLAGPYTESVFRVEGISLSPLDGKTQLELAWFDDLRSGLSAPYILDDETLNIRVTASGGRTCTLTNASTTITFSSGNLGVDGVAAGDILKVTDSGEAAGTFYRNRTLRIVTVPTTTSITVDVSDFPSGPHVITTWTIYRGEVTTARATYYGKTCTTAGTFYSGSTVYTRLLDG